MMKRLAILLGLGLLLSPVTASAADIEILPLRERAELRDRILLERLETVLPMAMRRMGVDMWIVMAREYNEDPVIRTMLPARWMAARRRTIFIFFDRGPEAGVERLLVARYDMGELYESVWDKAEEPDQWKRVGDLVRARNPKRIAVNMSETFALADGLTQTQFKALNTALGPEQAAKVEGVPGLAVAWLETRSKTEMEIYPGIVAIAHKIIAEGFSADVIKPGITTSGDLQWWYRERIAELKLQTWFHPSLDIQRHDNAGKSFIASFTNTESQGPIREGDLLHVDFGITYLGLNTDTQQHAYVLRAGESDAPEGLKQALANGNRLQDILTGNFVTGRSGNEILLATLDAARAEGLVPQVYTHPIGLHGHAAGPTIGMWDSQEGIAGRGDYTLFANTAYSIELNIRARVPEWGNGIVRIMLEEDAFFDGERTRYIEPRQTRLHLIGDVVVGDE